MNKRALKLKLWYTVLEAVRTNVNLLSIKIAKRLVAHTDLFILDRHYYNTDKHSCTHSEATGFSPHYLLYTHLAAIRPVLQP